MMISVNRFKARRDILYRSNRKDCEIPKRISRN